jgi:hypothetical protein
MDGVDVFKLFASDFGTVSVFAGERMINMMTQRATQRIGTRLAAFRAREKKKDF